MRRLVVAPFQLLSMEDDLDATHRDAASRRASSYATGNAGSRRTPTTSTSEAFTAGLERQEPADLALLRFGMHALGEGSVESSHSEIDARDALGAPSRRQRLADARVRRRPARKVPALAVVLELGYIVHEEHVPAAIDAGNTDAAAVGLSRPCPLGRAEQH